MGKKRLIFADVKKKSIILLCMVLMALPVVAQNENATVVNGDNGGKTVCPEVTEQPEIATEGYNAAIAPMPLSKPVARKDVQAEKDTLHLPPLRYDGKPYFGAFPSYYWGWGLWRLHQGLNVSLSASVFTGFGKNAPKGAGFGQTISAMYAMPLTDRLTLAVGGYLNNTFWQGDSYREGGISALIDYRFNDHWDAYAYAHKSILSSNMMPMPLYDMGHLGDRIGVGVNYTVNPSFSVGLSFETVKYKNPSFHNGIDEDYLKRH